MDNKANEKVVALRLKQRMPPRIRGRASTILKEARLSLDQAMCDAAVELGRPDAKGVYYPFGKSVADLRAARKEKCKRVDGRIVAYAMRFKPYYGGNALLWSLARLATHSHQRIVSARPQDTGAFLKAAFISAQGPLTLQVNTWSDLHNEMYLARLPAKAHLTLKADAVLPLETIFGKTGEAVAGGNLVRTLDDFIGIAERIVLGLEAETARLKSLP